MIDGFGSVLCVSVFQSLLLVIVIMIDGSEKRNCEVGFYTSEFAFLKSTVMLYNICTPAINAIFLNPSGTPTDTFSC